MQCKAEIIAIFKKDNQSVVAIVMSVEKGSSAARAELGFPDL